MSEQIHFSSEELDVLTEISNIGMGKAGSALAEAFGCFVNLKVPEILLIESRNLKQLSNAVASNFEIINIVRQSFSGNLNGESIVLLGETAYSIRDLLGYEASETFDKARQQELLLDISNSLTGACINGIAQELLLETSLSPPTIVCFEQPASKFYELLFSNNKPNWDQSLLVKVEFHLKDRGFSSDLYLFFSQSSLGKIGQSVKALLEN